MVGKYAQVKAMDQTEPQREIIRSVRGLQEAIETLQPQKRLQELLDALASRMEPLAQAMVRLSEELSEEREQNRIEAAEQRKIGKALARKLELVSEKIEAYLAKASEVNPASKLDVS